MKGGVGMASTGASTPGTAVAVTVGSWEAMREAVMVGMASAIVYVDDGGGWSRGRRAVAVG